MEIIDSQITVAEVAPSHPWSAGAGANGSHANEYESALAAMDAVGVDAAILIASQHYQTVDGSYIEYNNGYCETAASHYPARLASVRYLDHRRLDIDDQVAMVRSRPNTLGLRVVILDAQTVSSDFGTVDELVGGGFDNIFAAAQRHKVPVYLYASDHLGEALKVAEAYPELTLLIDHIGVVQPPTRTPDSPPLRRLPELLRLARLPNVAVRLSGMPTLSGEAFPFRDVWPAVHAIIGTFGPDRVVWGSDYTRCAPVCSYAEGLLYLLITDELTHAEKELILGGNLRRLMRWPAD